MDQFGECSLDESQLKSSTLSQLLTPGDSPDNYKGITSEIYIKTFSLQVNDHYNPDRTSCKGQIGVPLNLQL